MKKVTFLRRISVLLSAVLLLTVFTGCQSNEAVNTDSGSGASASIGGTDYPMSLVDDLGNTVELAAKPEKVVSLAPSVTEILFAIGAGDMVVGRTDYCNYPPEAESVDSIGTYSSPNMELIIEKAPDLVIASDFMDESIKSQLDAIDCAVFITSASSLDEIKDNISTIGMMLGLSDDAEKAVEDIRNTESEIGAAISKVTEPKSAFFDLGSFYSAGAGSLVDNALSDINVKNIAAETGDEWPQLSAEIIVEGNPDVYISTFTSADELKAISGFAGLKCMEDGNLLVLEYELADMIQRAGPRFAQGELELAKLIYPDAF